MSEPTFVINPTPTEIHDLPSSHIDTVGLHAKLHLECRSVSGQQTIKIRSLQNSTVDVISSESHIE